MAALALVVVVLALMLIAMWRRTSRLTDRLHGLTRGSDERSLEAILEAHLERVFAVSRSVDTLASRTSTLETDTRLAVQRVGMVRFNPFEDTGGNQSFALALLDADGTGVILELAPRTNGDPDLREVGDRGSGRGGHLRRGGSGAADRSHVAPGRPSASGLTD